MLHPPMSPFLFYKSKNFPLSPAKGQPVTEFDYEAVCFFKKIENIFLVLSFVYKVWVSFM